jgi:hypothetical protein
VTIKAAPTVICHPSALRKIIGSGTIPPQSPKLEDTAEGSGRRDRRSEGAVAFRPLNPRHKLKSPLGAGSVPAANRRPRAKARRYFRLLPRGLKAPAPSAKNIQQQRLYLIHQTIAGNLRSVCPAPAEGDDSQRFRAAIYS